MAILKICFPIIVIGLYCLKSLCDWIKLFLTLSSHTHLILDVDRLLKALGFFKSLGPTLRMVICLELCSSFQPMLVFIGGSECLEGCDCLERVVRSFIIYFFA